MKEHVAHISRNVSPCPKATSDDQARCKQAIVETKNKNRGKKKEKDSMSGSEHCWGGR